MRSIIQDGSDERPPTIGGGNTYYTREEIKMKITVAGTAKEVEDGLTVAKLIEQENVETPQYVTVSINEEFIESGSFDTHVLNEGDEVEFLYFMGGGGIIMRREASPLGRSIIRDDSDEWPPNGREGAFPYGEGR